jgi:hypothetical protein
MDTHVEFLGTSKKLQWYYSILYIHVCQTNKCKQVLVIKVLKAICKSTDMFKNHVIIGAN